MAWLQLKIESAKADAERIEEALELVGAGAIMMEDAADQPLFEPPLGTTPLWDATRLVALFTIDSDMEAILEFLNEHLEGGLPSHRVEILEDQVWERAWMDHYHPMCFGDRLWVVPSWTPPPQPNAINLLLDPDLDPQALLASKDNAARNHVADKMTVCFPDAMPEIKAGVVVANILAGPLAELAPVLARLCEANGDLAISGIIDSQVEDLKTAYAPWVIFDTLKTKDENWCRLSGKRLNTNA